MIAEGIAARAADNEAAIDQRADLSDIDANAANTARAAARTAFTVKLTWRPRATEDGAVIGNRAVGCELHADSAGVPTVIG